MIGLFRFITEKLLNKILTIKTLLGILTTVCHCLLFLRGNDGMKWTKCYVSFPDNSSTLGGY